MAAAPLVMVVGIALSVLLIVVIVLTPHVDRLASTTDKVRDLIDTDPDGKEYGTLRTVTMHNLFPQRVAVYFQDNEAGAFIAAIDPLDHAKVRASDNQIFFVTEENGSERLAAVTVRAGVSEYDLAPQRRGPPVPRNEHVEYSVDARETARLHPQVVLTHSRSLAMAAKFKSLSARTLDMWFDDGGSGVWEGHLRMGQETTTNTYVGHVFIITVSGDKKTEVARFRMHADQVTYVIHDPAHPADASHLQQNAREEAFTAAYLNRTGVHWRHYYGPGGPRPPPMLYMWPGDKVGQVHTVTSPEGFWHCAGKAARCKGGEPVAMELEVVSVAPRAFIIPQFLSDYEAESIIAQARPHISSSSVGDAEVGVQNSDTRTSKNTWLHRTSSPVLQSLFLRAADLLGIDERLLVPRSNAEDLQVVHYEHGQKYDPHHDWGVSGKPESRFATLLLYLTDQEGEYAGGETAFPKGNDGLGFKVRPKKGAAVLFYNLLEDGNGDDLALHASLPTVQGEKWLCNFWIWDPHFH